MGRERQLLASGAERKGGCLPLPPPHTLLALSEAPWTAVEEVDPNGGKACIPVVHNLKKPCAMPV